MEVVAGTVVEARVAEADTLLVVKELLREGTLLVVRVDHHMLHVEMILVEMVVDMLHDHDLQMVEDHNLVATIVLLVVMVHPIDTKETTRYIQHFFGYHFSVSVMLRSRSICPEQILPSSG